MRTLSHALDVAGRIRFREELPRDYLSEAYAEADALLFPVRWKEPFGLVPLEAMARGTPVVGCASGRAAAYVKHERTALVVAPDDPKALAGAVMRLRSDNHLRAALRAAGRQTAESYPAERTRKLVSKALYGATRLDAGKPRSHRRLGNRPRWRLRVPAA